MEYNNEMLAFTHSKGVLVDRIITDGKLRRAPTVDKPKSLEAWIVARGNRITIGNWRTGMLCTWHTKGYVSTHQDKEELRLARAAFNAEVAIRQLKAIKSCKEIWQQTVPTNNHPYLSRKHIHRHIAQVDRFNNLVVPISSFDGQIKSLQFITPNGDKRFKSGASSKGHAALIGDFNSADVVLVCEGYATGCSLHEATNGPVIVAFNAGNLELVCKAVTLAYPKIKLVICADNDHQSESNGGINVGLDKARKIAKQLNIALTWPRFAQGDEGTDFNDIHCSLGLSALTKMLTPLLVAGDNYEL